LPGIDGDVGNRALDAVESAPYRLQEALARLAQGQAARAALEKLPVSALRTKDSRLARVSMASLSTNA
jgi:hypothetical protein